MPSESSMQFPPQKGNIKSWRETKINNMFGEDILWDSTGQQLGKKVSSMAVLKKQKAGEKEKKNRH